VIAEAAWEAGVVGAGGGGAPTYLKLRARADTVVGNGVECEPLLGADRVTMRHHAEDVVHGLACAAEALGAVRAVLAVSARYSDAGEALRRALPVRGRPAMEIVAVEPSYPAGDEDVLCRQLGLVGGTARVFNVQTLRDLANADEGVPLTHRYVAVSGAVAAPRVLRVPIGAPVVDCLRRAVAPGAVLDLEGVLVLAGGPLRGAVLADPRAARVDGATASLVVLPRRHRVALRHAAAAVTALRRTADACNGCRRCTDVCPPHRLGAPLQPHRAARAAGHLHASSGAGLHATLCTGCGLCDLYACPLDLSPRAVLASACAGARTLPLPAPRPGRAPALAVALVSRAGLVSQLELLPWADVPLPLDGAELRPADVLLPPRGRALRVAAGARVHVGARLADGDSASGLPPLHASLDGTVTRADAGAVVVSAAERPS
jgi:Na+-translocating ferredoxin:NAD+ oxidoreductase RnfC subunit